MVSKLKNPKKQKNNNNNNNDNLFNIVKDLENR